MQRLRHPIRSITEPFGKAGLTVAILALVLAMVGGAYAAGGLSKSQEKQVIKIAKKYAGKPGAPGANGSNGAPGEKGSKGDTGAPGESVTASAAGGECGTAGGTKFKVGATESHVCNGTTGFTETLPEGKTETGAWSIGTQVAGYQVSISFSIPLESSLDGAHTLYVNTEEWEHENGKEPPAACQGTVAAPQAQAGYLCVYESIWSNHIKPAAPHAFRTGALGGEGAGKAGTLLFVEHTEAEGQGSGTFAVTEHE